MKLTALMIAALALCAGTLSAQTPAGAQNTISGGQKFLHTMIKNNIVRSAEKMPEENYAFKPTPDTSRGAV